MFMNSQEVQVFNVQKKPIGLKQLFKSQVLKERTRIGNGKSFNHGLNK